MKKLLPTYAAHLIVLTLMLCSCVSSGTHYPEVTLEGTWQLKQQYNNEGEDTPLKEFPLSDCNKNTTLEISDNGRFIEKNYYEDSNISGECAKDSADTKGDWKKGSNDMFVFIYDKNSAVLFKGATVTVENGDLIVSAIYHDRDFGPRTILKFMYSRIK